MGDLRIQCSPVVAREPNGEARPRQGNEPQTMEWPEAMRAAMDGMSVRRLDWDDESVVVRMVDDALCIYMHGAWQYWIVTRADTKARDWTI